MKLPHHPSRTHFLSALILLSALCPTVTAEPRTKTFTARDTFTDPRDDKPAAQKALDELKWKPQRFTVTAANLSLNSQRDVEARAAGVDALITFPSPHPIGDEQNDTVVLEWFAPRDENGDVVEGPAMLVLHILDGRMKVARAFARGFSMNGIHAFVMHMPHYGRRRAPNLKPDAKLILEAVRQGVADGRRAKDAIAALPNINAKRIGIQGTSLGGFICTSVASTDGSFRPVFPTLCGGDLKTLFRDGQNEVAKIKEELAKQGITLDDFHAMLARIEPNLLAHRLPADATWMFNAEHDAVIPAANARALAKAIGLPADRHIWMTGGHVSCIIHLPEVVKVMVKKVKTEGEK